jgi:calcineurin-like phosphoesterase family protein
MAIWFTSDSHYNHANVIEHDNRPFSCLEEMTEQLIERWNNVVSKGDTVYHLGDFALSWGSKHEALIDGILSRLNGNKFLIIGNHDRKEVLGNRRWSSVDHYRELKIDMGGVHKQRIVMFHYSCRTWNQSGRGSWCLHGHSHGNLTDIGGKTMDVGVTCHDYRPIELAEVKSFMDGRSIVSCDHHRDENEPAKPSFNGFPGCVLRIPRMILRGWKV